MSVKCIIVLKSEKMPKKEKKKTKKTHIHHHSMFPEQTLSLLAADKKRIMIIVEYF